MSTFHRQIKSSRFIKRFLDFVFPPVCINCNSSGAFICLECRSQFKSPPSPICPKCGRPIFEKSERCFACYQAPLPLAEIRAAVMYEEPIPKIIHQLKYNGLFSLALPLANLMCQAWPKWTHQFDMIIPIPLHPERERKRGYNQAELLAKVVGQSIDISCNNRALQRIKNTQPQVRLNLLQRRENVKFAFKADKDLVRNKNLLLVDDVCTTGATLSSAAETLIASGANIVSAYCLARA